ncbi:MAG TPA: enoyl-CoA hydratase-related protein [Dehalococcoidia bacterium]
MDEVLFDKRADGVGLITLNRPDSLNALTGEMFAGLGGYLDDCERDAAVRCVALTGAGRAFCAGGDVKAMAAAASGGARGESSVAETLERWAAELRHWHDATSLRLHTMPKPVVAIVNGHATGAGMALALACDVRLCSDRARFGTAFRNVGLSGDFGLSYFLPLVAGTGRARELFFTAEVIDAAKALEYGIANRVFEHDSLTDEALAFCAALAAGPTGAFGRMKANLNLAESGSLQAVLDQEAFSQRLNRLSADHKEAAAAFVEKRQPQFRGV